MTDNVEHNNVNENNSIDLNDLYNLNRCLGGKCVANSVPQQFAAPTIEQLVQNPVENVVRSQALQDSINETPFADSSPTSGILTQMYEPITKTQSELYPTPAVVNREIENNQNSSDDKNAADLFVPYEVTRESLQYLNGFIRTQIGRRVTIDFVIGSDTVTQKSGYLLAVAQNYLLLNELDTNDVTACDLYTMKFIRFYY